MEKLPANQTDEGEMKFSYFKAPIKNTTPLKNISLSKVHELIISDRWKDVTEDVRMGIRLKDKDLSYCTFSCTCSKRDSEHVTGYSGFFCADGDHCDIGLKDTVAGDSFLNPAMIFISPSGTGLKILIKINKATIENHLNYFNAISHYLDDTYQLKIDQACKDVVRACFLCHDPEAFYSTGSIDSENLLSILPDISATPATFEQLPDNYHKPSEELNRLPMIHSRAISALKYFGWQQQGENWTRPGKDPKDGISAKFNRDPKDGLYKFTNFSSNGEPFGDKGYTDVGVICLLEYKDDFKACISELKAEYLTPTTPAKKRQQPVKIGLLPIDGMPKFIQDFISTCSETFNTPRDFWAGGVIISTALGIGDKLELFTKYLNVPILWLCLIGEVSSGKSESLSVTTRPFENLDKEAFRKWQIAYALYEQTEAMSVKDRREAGIERMQKPGLFQYLVKDITPEALTPVHAVNQRGVMNCHDELKGMIDDFGKYTGGKSGEQSNLISSYSQISMVTNRKGGGKESILRIDKPCILICGGIQPELLETLAADSRMENGFLARFCNVWPDNAEKPNYNKKRVPDELLRQWDEYILKLVSIPETENLTLSVEAENLHENWYNKNAAITRDEDSGYLKGVYGKLDYFVLRLAVVIYGMNLHAGGRSYSNQITGEEMTAAINITEYFRATALKVYHKLFDNRTQTNTKEVIRYLSDLGNSQNEIAKVCGVSQPYVNKILK